MNDIPIPTKPDHRCAEKGKNGWCITERYKLPAGYWLHFWTFRNATGVLHTEGFVCGTADRSARRSSFSVQSNAQDSDIYAVLAETRPHRVTERVATSQHDEMVKAHLERMLRSARTRYRLHAGAGPELDTAIGWLPEDDEIHTIQFGICMAGAGVARERIIAAMTEGFAISAEMADLKHPIVTVIDGRRTFVETKMLPPSLEAAA